MRRAPLAVLFVLAAALALVAAAFAKTDSSSAPAARAASDAALISCSSARVGFMGPITGDAASIGQEQLHWVQFAGINFNARHHTKYQIIQSDTQLNPALASTRAAQLASNRNVLAVLGPAGSQEVLAVAKTFRGMPYVSASATRTTLTVGKSRIRTFSRVVPNDSIQGPSTARFIRRFLKADNVYVIDDQEAYSVPLANSVQSNLRATGATVTRDSVSQSTTDFSSIVTKIGSSVDVVYLPWQLAPRAATFYQQMKEQGKRAVIVGSDGLDSSDFRKANGSYYAAFAPDIHNSKSRVTRAVVAAYQKRFGKFNSNFGPPAYEGMLLILDALQNACADGTATRAEVAVRVRKVNHRLTILGQPIRLNRNGDVIGAKFFFFKLVNGKSVFVQ